MSFVSMSAGRAMPTGASPSGNVVAERIVELDATSAGLPTTYVFYCGRFVDGSIITKPMGQRA
jgi:hypothetical protein